MQLPDDNTLKARGIYTTLAKERKTQIERVRTACQTLMTAATMVLRDCELKPPETLEGILTIETCLTNIKASRAVIGDLCKDMAEIESEAWNE